MNKKLEDTPKQELEIITDRGPCCKITNGYLDFEINKRRARGFFIRQMVSYTNRGEVEIVVLWEEF